MSTCTGSGEQRGCASCGSAAGASYGSAADAAHRREGPPQGARAGRAVLHTHPLGKHPDAVVLEVLHNVVQVLKRPAVQHQQGRLPAAVQHRVRGWHSVGEPAGHRTMQVLSTVGQRLLAITPSSEPNHFSLEHLSAVQLAAQLTTEPFAAGASGAGGEGRRRLLARRDPSKSAPPRRMWGCHPHGWGGAQREC